MRLVTYEADRAWRSGILIKDAVVDTADAADRAGLGDGDWHSNRFVISAPAATRQAL